MRFSYYADLALPSQNGSNKYRGAAVIIDFLADYPAISSGLLQGDAIVSVDGYPVMNESTMRDAGDYITGGRPVEMRIVRPSKYSLTQSGSITLFPPFTEHVYSVPVKLCPWQR
jgi:S1-C subfamily serine protease